MTAEPGRAQHDLARHDLVWLRDWRRHARAVPDDALMRLDDWFGRDRPAIVRRPAPGDPDGVALGVALPAGHGCRRIALTLAPEAVVRSAPPPLLNEVVDSAPARWREPLARLSAIARSAQLEPRVYGSLLWQHLTGEWYMHAQSDLDLLLPAAPPRRAWRVLELLREWEQATGLRADGELLLGDGSAVAWRELYGDSAKVLVKSADQARLTARADLPWPATA